MNLNDDTAYRTVVLRSAQVVKYFHFTTIYMWLSTLIFCLIGSQCTLLQAAENISSNSVLVQSTTSTANSGLYDYLLPIFLQDTGISVRVVAVGTGQAIKNARNCDADVLLVHAKESEEAFIREGFGQHRHDLMYNDFVLVGPATDPAKVGETSNVITALENIARSKSRFASRGDNSGTHKAEIRLWSATLSDPVSASGTWYLETGSGMGATLNTAVGMGAYTLTDRATWISFTNKRDYVIVSQGDIRLYNQYGIILVNKEKCPLANVSEGQQFIDWMTSTIGQKYINQYSVAGQQLFFANAQK